MAPRRTLRKVLPDFWDWVLYPSEDMPILPLAVEFVASMTVGQCSAVHKRAAGGGGYKRRNGKAKDAMVETNAHMICHRIGRRARRARDGGRAIDQIQICAPKDDGKTG